MTLEVEILETSFDALAPRADELVDIFYRRLFEAAPEVEPMFEGAEHAQPADEAPRHARVAAQVIA